MLLLLCFRLVGQNDATKAQKVMEYQLDTRGKVLPTQLLLHEFTVRDITRK